MIATIIFPLLHNAAGLEDVASRIYRDWPLDTPQAPYIVWDILNGSPDNNLSNRPPGDRWGISVDIFAETPAQADALTAAARTALESVGHVEGLQSLGREQPTGLWRYSITAELHRPR